MIVRVLFNPKEILDESNTIPRIAQYLSLKMQNTIGKKSNVIRLHNSKWVY